MSNFPPSFHFSFFDGSKRHFSRVFVRFLFASVEIFVDFEILSFDWWSILTVLLVILSIYCFVREAIWNLLVVGSRPSVVELVKTEETIESLSQTGE